MADVFENIVIHGNHIYRLMFAQGIVRRRDKGVIHIHPHRFTAGIIHFDRFVAVHVDPVDAVSAHVVKIPRYGLPTEFIQAETVTHVRMIQFERPDIDGRSDGNAVDPAKFHSYADTSGFYLDINQKGDYKKIDDRTWHIDKMQLALTEYGTVIDANLDVTCDGTNYVVSNVDAFLYRPGYEENGTDIGAAYFSGTEQLFSTVSPEMIEEDRKKTSNEKETSGTGSNTSSNISSGSSIFNETWKDWYNNLFSWWDGSPDTFETLIKKNLNDEKSYKFIDVSPVVIETQETCDLLNGIISTYDSSVKAEIGDVFYDVEFSAKNMFNATIKSHAYGLHKYREDTVYLLAME